MTVDEAREMLRSETDELLEGPLTVSAADQDGGAWVKFRVSGSVYFRFILNAAANVAVLAVLFD